MVKPRLITHCDHVGRPTKRILSGWIELEMVKFQLSAVSITTGFRLSRYSHAIQG